MQGFTLSRLDAYPAHKLPAGTFCHLGNSHCNGVANYIVEEFPGSLHEESNNKIFIGLFVVSLNTPCIM